MKLQETMLLLERHFHDDKADKEKHYGKEIFANFIQSNYKSINFDNFRPMLNNIVKVIAEFAGTEG